MTWRILWCHSCNFSLALTTVDFSLPEISGFLQCVRYSPKKIKKSARVSQRVSQKFYSFISCTFSPNDYFISRHQSELMHTNTSQKLPSDMTLKTGPSHKRRCCILNQHWCLYYDCNINFSITSNLQRNGGDSHVITVCNEITN